MKKIDFFLIPYVQDGVVTGSLLVVNLLAQDLGASPFQLGLLGLAWGLSYAVGCAVAGRWADRRDRRVLLVGGVALFTATVWLYQGCATPWQIISLNLFNGVACALFWPVFETLLHDDTSEKGTRQRLGLFNVGWTCGIASGTASGGYLKEMWGTPGALNFWTALSLANLLYLAWRIRGLSRPATPPLAPPSQGGGNEVFSPLCEGAGNDPHSPPCEGGAGGGIPDVPSAWHVGFLYMAWIANFTLWFTGGAASQLFPKLGRELFFPDRTIGLLLSLITVTQGLSFLVLARTARWHYRLGPLLAFQAVSVVGMMWITGASGWSGLALGMGLLGIGRGMSYSASLYYALVASHERGVRTGIHEMLIGAAYVLGPFLGGVATEVQSLWFPLTTALRAPFQLCAGVTIGGMAVEYFLWRRMVHGTER